MTQLIIAEKPAAASRIAQALAENKVVAKKKYQVTYYSLRNKGKDIIVAPAVGHLFSLAQKSGSQGYPVLDPEWRASYETNKSSAFTKAYVNLLKFLAKSADEVIVATDYDREGSVIGYNCVRFLTGKKDAKRMKFSTLTYTDLKYAYDNMTNTLDWGQVNSGIARHYLDFFWGISLSKAAMSAVSQASQKFIKLSIGRVQGPALHILTDRELEIEKFVPKDYWEILALVNLKGKEFEALHKQDKFWDEAKANEIYKKVKDKDAKVSALQIDIKHLSPPVPFDLTSLQVEAYGKLKITPKQTLMISQSLYTKALISYPRTSSQKLPAKLGFKKILQKLSKNPSYSKIASEVLKTSLKPNEGKKDDPAHPAIYPTGELAKGLKPKERKLYDLIVKRFFAVFGEKAEAELTHVEFDIEKEIFVLHGQHIIKKGWIEWYSPYYMGKEVEIPKLKTGEIYHQKTSIIKKQTKPPARYTAASIIKELEKEGLGTKATRATIIDTLYSRGYISGTSIKVSTLGKEMVSVFSKYAPEILSRALTSEFEQEMKEIRTGKVKKEDIIERAKKLLIKICKDFDKHKEKIGKEISEAAIETQKEESTLMRCPKCNKGNLRMIFSKKTRKRFLACDKYPDCKTTWPLPQRGLIKVTTQKCPDCNTPKIGIYSRGRRPWIICPNPDCPSKKSKKN
ncbi:MAG: DNA topoisomerase I [Candidatus Woesearchaeota archaeon]|nr:MAG: DNA topoisomerase I [Candidatus Woesearchaeota archaeon]